jgi:hypothetical protein
MAFLRHLSSWRMSRSCISCAPASPASVVHRGALDIESTPGQGSVFTIHPLPHPATTGFAAATSAAGDSPATA